MGTETVEGLKLQLQATEAQLTDALAKLEEEREIRRQIEAVLVDNPTVRLLEKHVAALEAELRLIGKILGVDQAIIDVEQIGKVLLMRMAEHARATELERELYGLIKAQRSTWEQAEATDNDPATGEGCHG